MSKLLLLLDFLYLSYSLFYFLMSFLTCVVNQVGSVLRAFINLLGTCLFASSIPARSQTFVEIDHEIISTVILLLPLIYSRRVVVSYKRKYVHELLVNSLYKPAQEKVWIGELTVPQ